MLETVFFQRHRFIRQFIARPRLTVCAVIGLALLAFLPGDWQRSTRALIAWNAGIFLYLVAAAEMMIRSNEQTIRRRAVVVDESRFVVLALACVAASASVVAIVAQLAAVKDTHGVLKMLHIGLAALTIVSAWTFIHVVFAQHYAHEYFVERKSEKQLPNDERGGLKFGGSGQPDYFDFLYFSFVIGVAAQTADVEICSKPMRRVALVHCVLSFFFNTTVLALTINIAAGLI
jgi:uncharacterized membrane protein